MRKTYFFSLIALIGITATAAVPTIEKLTDYTGTTATVHWDGQAPEGLIMNVFSMDGTESSFTETFASLNHADGKLDTSNPGIPENWEMQLNSEVTPT